MKWIFRLKVSLLMMVILFTYSCQKNDSSNSNAIPSVSANATSSVTALQQITPCGTPTQVALRLMPKGGGWVPNPTTPYEQIGTVTVSNDENNLYVTYSITSTQWALQQLRLFVGDHQNAITDDNNGINEPDNPTLGHYEHVVLSPNLTNEYRFTIPLSDIAECVDVMAFAQLQGINGNKGSGKSWGVGTAFEGVRPAYWINYCKQQCTSPSDCWGAGTTATGNGQLFSGRPGNNWFELTTYPLGGGTVPLISGQVNKKTGENPVIGTIYFSAPYTGTINGVSQSVVDISVTFNAGWRLDPGSESVKVQPTNESPMTWLEPGKFEYKKSRLPITVPEAKYYAIHLTVQPKVACPTP